MTTGAHYFDWHHTKADTLDKVDPTEFRKNVASLAVMTYILADMPETLVGHKRGWRIGQDKQKNNADKTERGSKSGFNLFLSVFFRLIRVVLA